MGAGGHFQADHNILISYEHNIMSFRDMVHSFGGLNLALGLRPTCICLVIFSKKIFFMSIVKRYHIPSQWILKASFWGLFRTNFWELNFSRTKIVQDFFLNYF